jgi:hypothetical protein
MNNEQLESSNGRLRRNEQLASRNEQWKILGESLCLTQMRHRFAATRLHSLRVEPRVSVLYRLFAVSQRLSASVFNCSLLVPPFRPEALGEGHWCHCSLNWGAPRW